ncbi:MAG: DUF1214 domain-containing protein, partial [bacterium]|nr:DUF1214 domain-containing protein [bacterium]
KFKGEAREKKCRPRHGFAPPKPVFIRNSKILKGCEHYRPRAPAKAPFEHFWSLTPNSEHSRGLIRSGISERIDADRDSRDERLKLNENGTVDILFGPDDSKVPADKKANWMKTNTGEGWFLRLRLYAPMKEFFDRSWKLNDREKDRSIKQSKEEGNIGSSN